MKKHNLKDSINDSLSDHLYSEISQTLLHPPIFLSSFDYISYQILQKIKDYNPNNYSLIIIL